jgi:VWFA-related protein
VAALGASVVAAASLLGAQQPPAQTQPTFRTGVEIVQLDVSVLDKDRRPVRGLSADDFTVTVDGKPRPVVSFTAFDVPDPEPVTAAWMRDVAPDVVSNDTAARRVIVILMDDVVEKGDSSYINLGTKVAREIVNQLRPGDVAAVVFTFMGRHQTFTADRQKLLDAIASFRPAPLTVACYLKPTESCAVDAMERVADILATAPAGRKMMFYLGTNPLPPVKTQPGGLLPDPFDRMKYSMDLFRKLQAANITVDTFDISGLQALGPGGVIDDIRALAENTGGRAVVNTNTPEAPVPDIFSENSSYYLLGIESDAKPGDNQPHKIQVKTSRPGVLVRTRSGYFAPPVEKPKKKDTEPPSPHAALDAALATTLPDGGIPLDLSVVPFAAASGKGATLLVFTGLQASAARKEALSGEVELVERAYDIEGQPQSTFRQNIVVRPGSSARYEMIGQLSVRSAKRYEVRVAASGAGRKGSVFADLEVPDFERAPLSLSGVVLGNGNAKAPADAHVANLIPVVPMTVRTFTARDTVVAFMRIYRREKDKPAAGRIVATIVDDREKEVLERESPLDGASSSGAGGMAYRFDLPLGEMTPGGYLLRFDVSSGKTQASRSVRFTVR